MSYLPLTWQARCSRMVLILQKRAKIEGQRKRSLLSLIVCKKHLMVRERLMTRHTYVLPQQMIDQVKAVAQFFCCSEVSAAEQLIQKGLDDIKKKHGKKALTLQKTQTLFG